MATVTNTVPDPLVPRLRAAAKGTFPQHAALGDAALFKTVTSEFWRKVLADYERQATEVSQGAVYQATVAAAYDTAVVDGAGIV